MPSTPDTAFWLEGASAGELRIQRCSSCAMLRHPPRPMCPGCTSLEWDYIVAAGTGTLYSFCVYRHPPGAGPPVPYVVAVVELDEGVRVVGNVLDCDPDALTIEDRLRVDFLPSPDESLVLPQWRRL